MGHREKNEGDCTLLVHVAPLGSDVTLVPHELITDPRLGSEAVHLALWLLSEPEGSDLSIEEVARQAGIRKSRFLRAKRELTKAGYLQE
ncbi:hypothetical protein I5Q34_19385 [Streptomyces sp. AV19]|uniref:hypothetical protein n=1 Tax=Streptomyces sp. AV19 TaxID=2793068 RepID=UPI0018FEBA3C|nr:hypothetical protein [Streptomyces sp. AV19]MBH1936411.1 hypothetical protein [Streptomyces sp. AV19]MDG4532450.1 hypothetical protein [Streptomyces sp. AV19]